MVHVDVSVWGLVVVFVLPIAVALVTKSSASKQVKTATLIVLAAAITVGQSIIAAGQFEVKDTLVTFVGLVLAAVAAHLGVEKPLGLTGSEGAFATEGGIG